MRQHATICNDLRHNVAHFPHFCLMGPTTPNEALRVAIENAGMRAKDVAEQAEVNSQTLYSWLNGKNRLKYSDGEQRKAVERLAAVVDVAPMAIWEATVMPRVVHERRKPYVVGGSNLASLLIDVIENPQESEEHKRAARETLLEMVRERA